MATEIADERSIALAPCQFIFAAGAIGQILEGLPGPDLQPGEYPCIFLLYSGIIWSDRYDGQKDRSVVVIL